MKTLQTFETKVTIHPTAQHNVPEHVNLQTHVCSSMCNFFIKSSENLRYTSTFTLSTIKLTIFFIFIDYRISLPIRRTVIFSLGILEKIMMNVF